MDASKKAKWKNLLRVILFLFSLGILYPLLRNIGFDKIGDAVVRVGWSGAAILILFRFLENGSDALALHYSFPKKNRFIRIFAANCFGALINYLIPWEAGEFAKIGIMREEVGSEDAIKGVVIWNYIFKLSKACALFSMTVLAFICLFLMPESSCSMDKFWIITGCALLGFLPYVAMLLIIKADISTKIVKLLKFFGKKNTEELIRKAVQMDKDFNCFKKEHPKEYKEIFWIQFFARYVSLATFLLCIYFAGLESFPTISVLILAYCAIQLGTYITAFIPMKVGVGEGVGFLMFAFLGLAGTDGTLIMFILRVIAVIAMSLVSSLIIIK